MIAGNFNVKGVYRKDCNQIKIVGIWGKKQFA